MTEQNQGKKYLIEVYEVFLILLLSVNFLCLLALATNIPLLEFLDLLSRSLYRLHFNNCSTLFLDNLSINLYIYLFIVSTVIGFKILTKISFLRKYDTSYPVYSNKSVKVGIVMLVFLLGIQWIGHVQSFPEEFYSIHSKNNMEKYSPAYRELYNFSLFCHEHLPGKHLGLFITDMDIHHGEAGFYTQLFLAYFLYPITIKPIPGQDHYQYDNPSPPDTLIVFAKHNPLEVIPEDFEILAIYNRYGLIAVKNGIKKNDP